MSNAAERHSIQRLIGSPRTPIPLDLRDAFHRYQLDQHRRFLLLINLLGQVAYFSYVVADALVIPDVFAESLLLRSTFLALSLPPVLALFRWSNNVRLLDLLLPGLILLAAIAWFDLLASSASPAVATYQYASVIFIVLANLCVRVCFLASLLLSLLISAVILHGVHSLSDGRGEAVLVFALVYLPVLLFSLFISWSNTLAGRRDFLHSLLDDMRSQALAKANERLQALAETDALTGIGNRRRFDQQAQHLWERGEPFALLLADIDHFKLYNDHYGHPAGDRCLAQVAAVLSSHLRDGEHFVARYGGEEFAVLIATACPQTLERIAWRLVQGVQQLGLPHAHRPDGLDVVTLSMGGALSTSATGGSLEELLNLADARLYRAKHEGRNRPCIAESS